MFILCHSFGWSPAALQYLAVFSVECSPGHSKVLGSQERQSVVLLVGGTGGMTRGQLMVFLTV